MYRRAPEAAGLIINIGSMVRRCRAWAPPPITATKFGLVGLTKSTARRGPGRGARGAGGPDGLGAGTGAVQPMEVPMPLAAATCPGDLLGTGNVAAPEWREARRASDMSPGADDDAGRAGDCCAGGMAAMPPRTGDCGHGGDASTRQRVGVHRDTGRTGLSGKGLIPAGYSYSPAPSPGGVGLDIGAGGCRVVVCWGGRHLQHLAGVHAGACLVEGVVQVGERRGV